MIRRTGAEVGHSEPPNPQQPPASYGQPQPPSSYGNQPQQPQQPQQYPMQPVPQGQPYPMQGQPPYPMQGQPGPYPMQGQPGPYPMQHPGYPPQYGYPQHGPINVVVQNTNTSSSSAQVVAVMAPRRFNHGLHALITVFTCGAWLPFWIILAIIHKP